MDVHAKEFLWFWSFYCSFISKENKFLLPVVLSFFFFFNSSCVFMMLRWSILSRINSICNSMTEVCNLDDRGVVIWMTVECDPLPRAEEKLDHMDVVSGFGWILNSAGSFSFKLLESMTT